MIYLFGTLLVIATIKWGNLKNWKEYYPTILFFILVDSLYNFIMYNYRLWEYITNHIFYSLFVYAIIYPAIVLLFLSNIPVTFFKKLAFISIFVIIFIAYEWLIIKCALFEHHYGWNMFYSLIFDYIMFIILMLHHKRPLLAWLLTVSFAVLILYIFNFPLSSMK